MLRTFSTYPYSPGKSVVISGYHSSRLTLQLIWKPICLLLLKACSSVNTILGAFSGVTGSRSYLRGESLTQPYSPQQHTAPLPVLGATAATPSMWQWNTWVKSEKSTWVLLMKKETSRYWETPGGLDLLLGGHVDRTKGCKIKVAVVWGGHWGDFFRPSHILSYRGNSKMATPCWHLINLNMNDNVMGTKRKSNNKNLTSPLLYLFGGRRLSLDTERSNCSLWDALGQRSSRKEGQQGPGESWGPGEDKAQAGWADTEILSSREQFLRKEKGILRVLSGLSDGQCNSLSPKKPVKIYIYLSDFGH